MASKTLNRSVFSPFGIGLLVLLLSACVPQGFGTTPEFNLSSDLDGLDTSVGSNAPQIYAEGVTLYTNNCSSCHGNLASSAKRGQSLETIQNAIQTKPMMLALQSLSASDVAKIAYVLNNSAPTTGTPSVPITTTPVVTPTPVDNTSLKCVAGADPGVTPTRRLSKEEYSNTLITLFHDSDLIGRYNSVWGWFPLVGLAATIMGTVPDDDKSKQFSRLDHVVSSALLEGQFMVAQTLAKAVAQTSKLSNYAGSCSQDTKPTDACVNSFIASFGKKAYRRPVKADEVVDLKAIYDASAVTAPKDGFEAVIESLLLSPQFLFLMETEGTPVVGKPNLLKLTDYELAARLSYTLIQSMPTDELFAAADAGQLTTDDSVYSAQIDKLMVSNPDNMVYGVSQRTHPLMMSAFQRTVMTFYEEWLQVNTIPEFSGTAVMNAFVNVYNNSQFVWNDTMAAAGAEARDFVFRLTFLDPKKYSDLLTDNSAVLVNGSAQRYYHLPDGTPWDTPVTLTDRAGILTRAPFLTSGTELTSPVRRGVFIRRKILCDNLPSPNPDQLPDRSLQPPDADPNMTTRERYAAKTASATCQACHSQINPLGFALEDFDSLGRNRSKLFEPIFSVDGDNVTLVKKLDINASVASAGFTPNDNLAINGAIEMSHALAASDKANTCYVRQIYRFTTGRLEDSGDDCVMKAMLDSMNKDGGSMLALLKALPRQPNFKLRNMGN